MTGWFYRLLLVGVGGFFVLVGGLKLADPVAFARSISNYQIISGMSVWPVALWIAWMEVLSGCFLLFRKWREAALALLLLLLIVFEIALFSALLRGLDIDCGCFGTRANSSVSFALLRNLFLMAVLILGIKLNRSQASHE